VSANASASGSEVVKCGAQEAANFLPPNQHEQARFDMAAPILTQEYLKSILHYDPATGVFTWKQRTRSDFATLRGANMWNAKYSGKVAGWDNGRGYIKIEINSRAFRAHRLAFLYMEGSLPANDVDHINGAKDDNRWTNLRHVTHGENMRNQRKRANRLSDCMGVSWAKRQCQWVAYIYINSRRVHLGSFDIYDDAVNVRKRAEVTHGFHTNHGRVA